MQKVQSVLPRAAEERSWFLVLKRFLRELKVAFPAFNATGLKNFARGYIAQLRKKWKEERRRNVREPWQNCPRRAHGARKCGAVAGFA